MGHNFPSWGKDFTLKAAVNKAEKVLDKVDVKTEIRMINDLIPVVGAEKVRREMLLGLEKDWGKKFKANPTLTTADLTAEYHLYPQFDKLIDKLGITWLLLDNIAKNIVEGK